MLNKLKKRLKNQKGFTLIELLAVIVILGILAAIAIPAIGNIIQNSRVDALKADANQVMNSARLYNTQDPTHTPILGAELGDYIDNPILDNISVAVVGSGELQLSADGLAGTVHYYFNDATFEDINDKALWDAAPTAASGAVITTTP